ncbi:MAG: response regulator [Candidatus Omnitrophica bacterium]|nr:response regulator [Candidatus Omnitrophota bacterium]
MPVKKVLVVDDEPELLKAMRIRLASWGYAVLTAANGKEAVRLVKKEDPDAIILDIMMPEMDGIETLKRIRRFNKKVLVFMLTAYGDKERFEKTNKLGIAGFIHKGSEFENASEFVRVALKGQK